MGLFKKKDIFDDIINNKEEFDDATCKKAQELLSRFRNNNKVPELLFEIELARAEGKKFWPDTKIKLKDLDRKIQYDLTREEVDEYYRIAMSGLSQQETNEKNDDDLNLDDDDSDDDLALDLDDDSDDDDLDLDLDDDDDLDLSDSKSSSDNDTSEIEEKLTKLKRLLDKGLISEADYNKKKDALLDDLLDDDSGDERLF